MGAVLTVAALVFVSTVFNATPAQAAEYEVKMGSDASLTVFVPNTLTISAGDTVKWVNNKMPPHNVVVDGHPELSHQTLAFAPTDSFTSTFETPGSYSYYCMPHRGAGMTGTITVK